MAAQQVGGKRQYKEFITLLLLLEEMKGIDICIYNCKYSYICTFYKICCAVIWVA
uniref:Uncharacterized protein n=1 Tax=Malurus cyaneus samueli TaxID=2593467 RepID=A0A8C5TKE8_9PASS